MDTRYAVFCGIAWENPNIMPSTEHVCTTKRYPMTRLVYEQCSTASPHAGRC